MVCTIRSPEGHHPVLHPAVYLLFLVGVWVDNGKPAHIVTIESDSIEPCQLLRRNHTVVSEVVEVILKTHTHLLQGLEAHSATLVSHEASAIIVDIEGSVSLLICGIERCRIHQIANRRAIS